MIKIDSVNEEKDLLPICAQVFKSQKLKGDAIVELDFVSEEEIRQLNNSTRAKDSVTDVLSFPTLNANEIDGRKFDKKNFPYQFESDEKAVLIGSIVICLNRAKEQATEYGHSEKREVCYLFLHGLLHLLGYDHMEEEEKSKMRAAEDEVLVALNITR